MKVIRQSYVDTRKTLGSHQAGTPLVPKTPTWSCAPPRTVENRTVIFTGPLLTRVVQSPYQRPSGRNQRLTPNKECRSFSSSLTHGTRTPYQIRGIEGVPQGGCIPSRRPLAHRISSFSYWICTLFPSGDRLNPPNMSPSCVASPG